LIGKQLHSKQAGVLASFLALTSVGFMQFARFGTFEMWLTFFTVLLFFLCIQLQKKHAPWLVLLTGGVLGILISTKISSLALFPLPIIAYLLNNQVSWRKNTRLLLNHLGKTVLITVYAGSLMTLVYLITNPYVFTDFTSFRSSMNYETSVALGTLPVFYTQEFNNTLPVIYHFLHVYPFLLNPLLTGLFLYSFLSMVYIVYKTKHPQFLLLISFFLITFLSQAFLFVKWIRYMVPTLPFIYLMTSIVLTGPHHKYIRQTVTILTVLICFLFTGAYASTVQFAPDTRITAKDWAKRNLSTDQPILSESYDLGIMPFNEVFPKITLCTMYDLEIHEYVCNNQAFAEIEKASSTVILPSQRVLQTRIRNNGQYPIGHQFYTALLHETNKYHKVYITPCTFLCKILYLGDPAGWYEQTASVFDRPIVYIFQKK
jgi:hypothetical protein